MSLNSSQFWDKMILSSNYRLWDRIIHKFPMPASQNATLADGNLCQWSNKYSCTSRRSKKSDTIVGVENKSYAYFIRKTCSYFPWQQIFKPVWCKSHSHFCWGIAPDGHFLTPFPTNARENSIPINPAVNHRTPQWIYKIYSRKRNSDFVYQGSCLHHSYLWSLAHTNEDLV